MGFQLMLEQANSFYVCAKMCGNKMKKLEGRIDIYATPMIVNLSFACEVYIKTLLDYLENGSKKSHKLNELLDALPDEKKSRILKEVEEKHGALADAFGIPVIDTVADAFAKWRYSYEVSRVSCDIGYLFALTEAVRNKDKFYIFDFCGNFEFFRMNKGRPTANMIALQGAIFHLKAQIAFKLQDLAYQTTDLIAFRKTLVEDMVRKVQELNKDNFAVRQHLKYVERYAEPDSYNALTYEDTLLMGQELAPLITPEEDDAKALRFDALMYGIELAYLAGKKYAKARSDLFKKVSTIASVANIPEIMVQAELIDKILHTDYVETAGINEFEHIRENLRDLIKYIPVSKVHYDTNFDDEILSVDWKESELENDDLKNYKAKAEFYVRQHMDDAVIAKLKSNVPLTAEDVQALEKALWSEVGTKQDYEAEYGQKPLGEFVREIVGLDMNAAKEAFAQYLNDASLDSRQIYFVNQIVEYIVHNGMMKDLSVLQEAPFTDHGSIVEVFTDLTVWMGIRNTIEKINSNAVA